MNPVTNPPRVSAGQPTLQEIPRTTIITDRYAPRKISSRHPDYVAPHTSFPRQILPQAYSPRIHPLARITNLIKSERGDFSNQSPLTVGVGAHFVQPHV